MIVVVRHGETNLNLEGKLQGRNGLTLNKTGIEQVRKLKLELSNYRFSHIYSSPQVRAIETAEIIVNQKATIDDRLDVYDLGEADGLKKSEVELMGAIPNPKIYKGLESVEGYTLRIFAFMQSLKLVLAVNEHVLIVGHKCTTGMIGAFFKGLPADGNIFIYSSKNGAYETYHFNNLVE